MFSLGHCDQHVVLAGEMVVYISKAYLGAFGDVAHAGLVITCIQKTIIGSRQNMLPPLGDSKVSFAWWFLHWCHLSLEPIGFVNSSNRIIYKGFISL